MKTRIVKVNSENPEKEFIKEAGELIKSGEIVAIPTETVYGLAGDALNPASAAKIYAAKGRPSDNPLIVHIAETEALSHITREIPAEAGKLMSAFWPGPLTLIFEKNPSVPLETTGGLSTVAVRMPVNRIAQEIIFASGGYIAAPSANRSGRPSCTTAEHVYEDMDGEIPLIIDGGAVGIGIESTIVDFTGERPCLLRPGYINVAMLEEKIGRIDIDPSIGGVIDESTPPKAPGMKYRHYAPAGELYIVRGKTDNVTARINELSQSNREKGVKTAVIATDETEALYRADIVKSVGNRNDEDAIMRNLFKVLRELDSENAKVIYTEEFDTPERGMAIMNRLIRAAGHKVIDTEEKK